MGSRLVEQLLGTYPVDDPFWGGQDYSDDYSVDTEDSAQALGGFHAFDEDDCLNNDGRYLKFVWHILMRNNLNMKMTFLTQRQQD